jgi:glycosyltransferase involved in cell wall biosynthesis
MKSTVVMSAYNAEKYISQTIESVLEQTLKDFQFIIINNGSTDNTLELIKEYALKDDRIVIDDHENLGKSNAINKAVEEIAIGDYIFHIDADDIMLENRLESQLHFVESNNLEATSCLAYYITSDNRKIGKTTNTVPNLDSFEAYMAKNEPIGLLNPGFVVTRERFLEIGGYRSQFWPADDIDLYNRLTEIGVTIIVQSEILMLFRVHGDSTIAKKFIQSRKKYEWVRESMWARRKGEKEPTWEDYLSILNTKTFIQKLNWKRKAYAKQYLHISKFDLGRKKYIRFVFQILIGGLLQPIYVLKRVFSHIIRK